MNCQDHNSNLAGVGREPQRDSLDALKQLDGCQPAADANQPTGPSVTIRYGA
jgi:hypothetical protein